LQWSLNFSKTLAALRKALKPGGKLLFAIPGPNTLIELRTAWNAIDDKPHVNRFLSNSDLFFSAKQAFRNVELVERSYHLTYNSVLDLLRELKALGANHVLHRQQSGLLSKSKLKKFCAAYPLTENKIIASYQIYFGVVSDKIEDHQDESDLLCNRNRYRSRQDYHNCGSVKSTSVTG